MGGVRRQIATNHLIIAGNSWRASMIFPGMAEGLASSQGWKSPTINDLGSILPAVSTMPMPWTELVRELIELC